MNSDSTRMIQIQENTNGSSSIFINKELEYDVFLSFRGVDTRESFTSFLYRDLTDAGLHVYMDEEELHAGEDIHPSLMKAIENSRLSIPIFSPRYASSKSCLHEVAKMNECWGTRGQIIMPVFYEIEPSDVRYQRGTFEGSFHEHQEKKRVDSQVVNKWKQALHDIGFIKGHHIKGNQAKLVRTIVSEVTQLLKTYEVQLDDDYLVGIEQPVEEVVEMIQIYSSEVKIIGVCGSPGIGKTTLAKVVYNKIHQHFDGCTFISINPQSELCFLQNRLISDLLRKKKQCNSFDKNIEFIRHRFNGMKVLIVLDNVERTHIKALAMDRICLGPGSRVILTARKPEDLVEAKVQWYSVKPLDEAHACELFKWHAFGEDSPDREYVDLSNKIASGADGNPYIIRIVGCHLSAHRNKDDEMIWNAVLDQLRKGVYKELKELLKMSYKNLDEYQQKIYLDIACFLMGESNAIAYYMWNDCEFFPALSMPKLISMSLVKIGEKGELLMSNAARELGKILVSEEDTDPTKRTRLLHDEGIEVLRGKKGTNKIEAICLQFIDDNYVTEGRLRGLQDSAATSSNLASCPSSFEILDLQNIAGLNSLRFLRLHKAKPRSFKPSRKTERFTNLLPKLRWLNWEYFPEISAEVQHLCLENLIILDMSRSNVKQEWGGWELITKKAEKLKVILLAECNCLHASPILPHHWQLERLTFEGCSRLSRISIPFGTIYSLVYLNLKGCSDLTELPQGLSSMIALRELIIDGSPIKRFDAGSKMKSLQVLSACGCKGLEIINSIGELKSLTYLALDDTAIAELPDSICTLAKLQTLSLRNCLKVKELPSCVGDLTSLVKIDLSCTSVAALPPSVEHLKNLQVLLMERTPVGEFPSAIANMKTLQKIDFSLCQCMQGGVPDSINSLSNLKTLKLSATKVSSLPTNISGLSQLQNLDLHMCRNLQDLPGLPSSLTSLRVGFHNICNIPDLSYMTNLIELHLADNSNEHPTDGRTREPWSASSFQWITKLSKLEALELHILKVRDLPGSFSGLEKLRKLVLSCPHLECLPQLPSSLTTLRLQYCKSLSIGEDRSCLPSLSKLEIVSLSKLEVVHCVVRSIDLTGSSKLQHLKISDCCLEQIIGMEGLSCLQVLDMSNCPQFQKGDLQIFKNQKVEVLLDGIDFFQINDVSETMRDGSTHMLQKRNLSKIKKVLGLFLKK